jgi:RHS repeat-associated protein
VGYPYGVERWSSGTLPTDYRFTGQRLDGYIKLYLMGARPYDPELGRWISADPVCPTSTDYSQFSLALTVSYAETSVLTQLNAANRQGGMSSESAGLQVPGNPQLCNRFSYVANNPLGFTDPSGHDPIPPWRRFASKVCGVFAATFDTLAWVVSGAGVVLEGAGFVGVPVTVGEEPLTFLGTALLYDSAFNPIENVLSYGSFGFTGAGDWLSGASYIKLNPLTVGIGQDTTVGYAAIVVGSGMPLTPEAFTDFLANTAVVVYDYGRLLELIPPSFEIRIIGVTEDGLDILEIVPIVDE